MSRDIVHGIEIHVEPKAIYDTISTRAGLAAFWTPDVQGDENVDGELSFGFSEAPVRLPIRVTRLQSPTEIAWDCPGGFPFWAGTKVTWSLRSSEHGTKVVFRHDGFPDGQPEYEFGSVSLTWALIVARLKEVVEAGGEPNPALS
ncbi:MAG: SRPBCC domain-containing protein [Actinomycetota bacterium]